MADDTKNELGICLDCRWFDSSIIAGEGSCRRNPPPWSDVRATDWCGYWMPIAKVPRNAGISVAGRFEDVDVPTHMLQAKPVDDDEGGGTSERVH